MRESFDPLGLHPSIIEAAAWRLCSEVGRVYTDHLRIVEQFPGVRRTRLSRWSRGPTSWGCGLLSVQSALRGVDLPIPTLILPTKDLSMSRSARSWRRSAALAAASAATVLLAACGSGSADTAVASRIRVVEPAAAEQLLATQPAPTLIDVRTPEEYAEGHLEGAELVDFNAADFRAQIATYPRDASYVIYCRSGNRSAGARQVMEELGFTDVADIGGGILAWAQAGLPVTA